MPGCAVPVRSGPWRPAALGTSPSPASLQITSLPFIPHERHCRVVAAPISSTSPSPAPISIFIDTPHCAPYYIVRILRTVIVAWSWSQLVLILDVKQTPTPLPRDYLPHPAPHRTASRRVALLSLSLRHESHSVAPSSGAHAAGAPARRQLGALLAASLHQGRSTTRAPPRANGRRAYPADQTRRDPRSFIEKASRPRCQPHAVATIFTHTAISKAPHTALDASHPLLYHDRLRVGL